MKLIEIFFLGLLIFSGLEESFHFRGWSGCWSHYRSRCRSSCWSLSIRCFSLKSNGSKNFLPRKIFYHEKSPGWTPPPRFTKNPILVKKFIKKTMIDPKASRFLIPAGGAGISGQGKFFIWIPWHTTESMESMEFN